MEDGFFISAEIMPPLLKNGMESWVEDRIEKLSQYFDRFNIVTKSDRVDSIEFFDKHVKKFGPATVHYAIADKEIKEVEADLQRARECGVKSVLILGGDEPRDPSRRKIFAKDAIGIAKSNGYGFVIGAALSQYPDDPEFELKRLADKIEAGTDYIFLQPTTYPKKTKEFLDWAKRYLYEKDLDMPPVVNGIMAFDSKSGIERARNKYKIPVKRGAEIEVATGGINIRGCMKLYNKIKGNGNVGIYFTPFSFKQYKIMNKLVEELPKAEL